MKIPKISVSFAKDEIELYNFIKSKRSISVYIKDLLQVEMEKEKEMLRNHKTEAIKNKKIRPENKDV